jgi:small subunit ribosomal protein S7
MPRKGHIAKRATESDPVYGSDLVTKFVNSMMWSGKKSTAEGIFYEALTRLQQKGGDEPLKLFKKAVENCKPLLEVKTRRVGGANYQVPVEVRPIRRVALSMRWLREAAKKRSEKSMPQRLGGELMEAAEGRGGAMKKRDEVHRMAEANKAFSHFRF